MTSLRPLALSLAAVLCLALAMAVGGLAPFGRLALSLGLAGPAQLLFSDPGWAGLAAARAGQFDSAAARFALVPGADYNAGVALARAGRYAAALEAFDRAIAADPTDHEAAANFELISRIYAGTAISTEAAFAIVERDKDGPVAEAEIGLGNARASGTGDAATNTGTTLGLAELQSREQQAVRKQFDDRFMLANDRWLRTLADVPGEYLAARIHEERKRRAAAGLSPPDPEDPR